MRRRISKHKSIVEDKLHQGITLVSVCRDRMLLIVITAVMVKPACCGQECNEPGWFGKDCRYQCHCKGESCSATRDCDLGCETGWFGPQCQYRSAELEITVNGEVKEELTDNDNLTCLHSGLSNISISITATLIYPQLFSWLRLTTNDAESVGFLYFGFQFDPNKQSEDKPCAYVRPVYVSDTVWDLHCTTSWVVNAIKIYGPGVKSLCSLDVSLGRNVALKQKTTQSSTLDIWTSDKAVDGDTGPHDDHRGQARTCTHTDRGERTGRSWTLTLDRGVELTRINIYNRVDRKIGDCCEERLKGFTLTASDGSHTVFSYTDEKPNSLEMYVVVPEKRIHLVKTITITAAAQSQALALCEVQVFAESVCKRGLYGIECDKRCTCDPKEGRSCYVSTGGCPFGCKAGYTGPACQKKCEIGTYGRNCLSRCSEHCLGDEKDCNSNGDCAAGCEGDYRPPLCLYAKCKDKTFFGNNCEFKCRCNRECDMSTGVCKGHGSPRRLCQSRWFGPSCQYKRVDWKQGVPEWAADHYDTTCFDEVDKNNTRLGFALSFVTWVRVIARDADRVSDLELEFSATNRPGLSKCTEKGSVAISERTLDFQCRFDLPMDTVHLYSSNLMDVCGVYISAGRSMSLKQTTSSTSYAYQWKSDNAVDGYVPSKGHAYSSTCWHSNVRSREAKWTVQFSFPVDVVSFRLENVKVFCHNRTIGFKLQVYNDDNAVWEYEHVDTNCDERFIDILPETRLPPHITSVSIAGEPTVKLYFCEVHVFGDRVCPRGRFGLSCDRNCNCAKPGDGCFIATGACPSGCRPGFKGLNCSEVIDCEPGTYGPDCEQKCSQNCRGGHTECSSGNGLCTSGCAPGYVPPHCHSRCDAGWFGEGCNERCGSFCRGGYANCDFKVGTCKQGCLPGYQKPFCKSKCTEKYFGQDCSFPCNKNCTDQQCHHITGQCLNCPSGAIGLLCNDTCPPRHYGQDCQDVCSEGCLDGECDPVTGHCLQCAPGQRGDTCELKCEIGHYGPGCINLCSEFCAVVKVGSCEHVNGSCREGCLSGWIPPLCKEPKSLDSDPDKQAISSVTVTDPRVLASLSIVAILLFTCSIVERLNLSAAQRSSRLTTSTERPPFELSAWYEQNRVTSTSVVSSSVDLPRRISYGRYPRNETSFQSSLPPPVRTVNTAVVESSTAERQPTTANTVSGPWERRLLPIEMVSNAVLKVMRINPTASLQAKLGASSTEESSSSRKTFGSSGTGELVSTEESSTGTTV